MPKAAYFQRGLKSRHVSLIAISGILGSAFFLSSGYVFNQIGPGIFLAYLLGGLIAYITMACLAELSVNSPLKGSFISYSASYISPAFACGVGWSYSLSWIIYLPSECLAAGILMHNFVPQVPVFLWTALFGMFITFVNLIKIKSFGETSFWLGIFKIILLVGFAILALFIFFGRIGSPDHHIIGKKYLLSNGGLFPNGYAVLFLNMVILLTNFQGSEVIGLSAAESKNPKKTIPKILNGIAQRIIGLFCIPTLLLALIYPWQEANVHGSIFAFALERYGLTQLAHIFTFFLILGAISCANSGLYATSRSFHALAETGLAPKFLKEFNQHGLPIKATLLTLALMWAMLGLSYFIASTKLYNILLATSGFTGALCWIAICWSQLRYRRAVTANGGAYPLKYKIKGFPYLTHLSIWLQVICLIAVAWSPDLRASFYFGVPIMVIPMLIYKYWGRPARNNSGLKG